MHDAFAAKVDPQFPPVLKLAAFAPLKIMVLMVTEADDAFE